MLKEFAEVLYEQGTGIVPLINISESACQGAMEFSHGTIHWHMHRSSASSFAWGVYLSTATLKL